MLVRDSIITVLSGTKLRARYCGPGVVVLKFNME
jgi:hypothetical protein